MRESAIAVAAALRFRILGSKESHLAAAFRQPQRWDFCYGEYYGSSP